MKKKSSLLQRGLPVLICFLIGVGIGFFAGYQIAALMLVEMEWNQKLLVMVFMLVTIYLGILLQIILHETGHLLFGLASGYRFCSFRIGSVLWLKQDGRLRCKRYSLAGTAGQCLMEPPEPANGRIPYVLYNLGGVFLNLITAALFAVLYLLTKPISLLATCFALLSAFGLVFALTNGIPLHMGTVNNDGHNAISMGKCPEALHDFWLQTKVNAEMTRGVRLKDMPAEWFPLPSEVPLDNSMATAACVLTFNRVMDQLNFPLAEQIGQDLLQHSSGLIGLHQCLLQAELVYCELVGANRPERLAILQTKEYRKLMKTMRNTPGIIRIQYACALLQDGDTTAAEACQKRFEQIAKRYPYPAELESERELLAYAQTVAVMRSETLEFYK